MRKYRAQSPDDDVVEKFNRSIEKDVKYIYEKYLKKIKKKKKKLTPADWTAYRVAKRCHICGEEINKKRIVCNGKATHSRCGKPDKDTSNVNWEEYYNEKSCSVCKKSLDDVKVVYHCHLTREYRGAANNSCNLNYKVPNFIPVIFHNLSNYDAHLFIKNKLPIGGFRWMNKAEFKKKSCK